MDAVRISISPYACGLTDANRCAMSYCPSYMEIHIRTQQPATRTPLERMFVPGRGGMEDTIA